MRGHNSVIIAILNIGSVRARQIFKGLKTGLIYSSFIVSMTLFCPSPSYADRHCLPSLEAFYGARYVLRDESLACPAALEEAFEALQSAFDHATACGCSELASAMQALIEKAGDDGASCRSRATDILGQTERVKALIEVCHH